MRRRNWYTGQLVTEGRMDTAFSDVETAVWRSKSDFTLRGVLSGHVVAADSPASLDVVISGGTSYTPDGKRCFSVGDTTLDCSLDVDGISTNVVGVSSSKIISVFVVFDRNITTPEYDVTNSLVYTIEEESIGFEVVQGNEVASPSIPTAPALRGDAVLLCDITLVAGQTTITSGDISTDRRQSLVVLTRADGSKIHNGTVEGAVQDVLDILEEDLAAKRPAYQVGPNGNATINVDDGNIVRIGSQTGATHTYTLAVPTGTRRVITLLTIDNLGQIVNIATELGVVASFPASGQGSLTLARWDQGAGVYWYVQSWSGAVTISASP